MQTDNAERSRRAADEVRSHVDDEAAAVDRRFRTIFAVGAIALVAINAFVGLVVLRQQFEMRDVAVGMYDHGFLPAETIDIATDEFQRFAQKRASTKGVEQALAANQLLDTVIAALDGVAVRVNDSEVERLRRDARASVLAFEGAFDDGGPAIVTQLRQTREQLAALTAQLVEKGRQARDEIDVAAANCQKLLLGSIVGAVLFGVATLMVLRRSVAVSALSQISRMANYDALTGLPNRNLFQRRLQGRLESPGRGPSQIAVLSLDLDRFKYVNDTLGHQTGDRLLKEVAGRIQQIAPSPATVSRFGGDEFVVLLPEVRRAADAARIAERMVCALRAPYDFSGQRVLVGASVGIALAPRHGATVEEVLRNSDLALYLAKGEGKDQYRFFDVKLNDAVQRRRLMELDLREALEGDGVDVFYQPVIDASSGKIIACEALARWNRPGHGDVGPSDFIPLAEETGLILTLGKTVLRKACAAAAQWPGEIGVAVNLSGRQFQGGDLVATVSECLAATGLPASRLELEITESILINDKAAALKTLTALRQLGVRIALDDFGAGYSSLSYLSSFPFDRIKIDRSFVTNVDERPVAAGIVCAVAGLASTLGMSTTAEGVETERDLIWIRDHGCNQAQGYLVSRPLPVAQIGELLRATSGGAAKRATGLAA